jgi:hypothetical protein
VASPPDAMSSGAKRRKMSVSRPVLLVPVLRIVAEPVEFVSHVDDLFVNPISET